MQYNHFHSVVSLIQYTISVSGWLEDYTGNWNASFILTGVLFLFAGIIVLMEPFIMRNFSKMDSSEKIDTVTVIPLTETIVPEVTDTEETGSLLDGNGADVVFTSARISRIYRPYDGEKRPKSHPSSPAPLFDTNEI